VKLTTRFSLRQGVGAARPVRTQWAYPL
jgi:hypothetical protein